MIYRAYFKLTNPVNNFIDAHNYLLDDDMTKYLLDDRRGKQIKDKIESIAWVLSNLDSGYIQLKTTTELTTDELDSISDWVRGQQSDGIGSGFIDQRFACYLKNPDDEDFIVADFDWRTNNYKFELYSS